MQTFLIIFFLVYTVVFYGFILFSFVHCCKAGIRRKPLYLILHFFYAGFSLGKIGGRTQLMLRWFAGLVGPFSIEIGGGEFYLSLLFPVGALFYWFQHNKIHRKARAEETAVISGETEPESPCEE